MAGGNTPNLFDAAATEELQRRAPLAARLRPQRLDTVVGQRHLLGPSAPLRRLVESDRLSSAIFFGPPGTGKTTVARLIATHSAKAFLTMSAVGAGVKEVREAIASARDRLGSEARGTILFLDEIHRFNRAQQDALLPAVEEGVLVLIGATTENPFFALNPALLSRSTLFRFEPLDAAELTDLLERGLECEGASASEAALRLAASRSGGDARGALTTLEVSIAIARSRDAAGQVDVADVEAAAKTVALRLSDDEHYDLLSALIKSVRGSDPDASVYWLARLLASGEPARAIMRRLLILASEDVGLADPQALVLVSAAASALEQVGLPEGSLVLSEAVLYLALAPKSNASAAALWAAEQEVATGPPTVVPPHLRDAHYAGARLLGHGQGYEYPHEHPNGYVAAQYLPEELLGRRYFAPTERGLEAERYARLAELRGLAVAGGAHDERHLRGEARRTSDGETEAEG